VTDYVPQVGDYGVIKSNGLFAKLIRIGTTSRWNHAFIYIGNYQGVDSIVEANPRGVAISPVSKYPTIAWNRHEELSLEQREGIVFYARRAVGKPYNFGIILVLALRALGLKAFPKTVTHWLAKHQGYICSELVAECYLKVGYPISFDPDYTNPGDLAERLIFQ
jgi:uncharacterized protein YycO